MNIIERIKIWWLMRSIRAELKRLVGEGMPQDTADKISKHAKAIATAEIASDEWISSYIYLTMLTAIIEEYDD